RGWEFPDAGDLLVRPAAESGPGDGGDRGHLLRRDVAIDAARALGHAAESGLSFVEIRGFAKAFGQTQVFEDVELDIAEGEMCILLGPSGCGKTTLLRAVAGLVRPDRGRLVIGGEDVTARPPQARGIAMTFQHYALFPNMT